MGPYLLEKRTSCWWSHETMRNIYYVEFNFLNLKYYVFEMFLPNINRIEWKIEKRQLFQNSCRFSTFYTHLRKDDVMSDVIVDLIRIFFSEIVHLISKQLCTKFKQSNFKHKRVMEGGGKHNETKKPSAYMVKLLNSVPFIKKTLVNHVCMRIWSFWLTFTVLQWMKTNCKISQFSKFLVRYDYAIQVKIWKCLKLLNSVPFIKKTLVNQVYNRIWSFWLTFAVLQWIKKNSD